MPVSLLADLSRWEFPRNLAAGVALLLLAAGIALLAERWRPLRMLFGLRAALLLTGACAAAILAGNFVGADLFRSWPFALLLSLLIFSLAGAVLRRLRDPRRSKTLFVLNHAGILLALWAALFGAPDRKEYKMALRRGVPENRAITPDNRIITLPFALLLDEMRIEYHPDGRTPRRFLSYITLRDGEREQRGSVEVNAPLRMAGYTILQDSYDLSPGKQTPTSIVMLVRDRWLWAVYAGMAMMALGASGMLLRGRRPKGGRP